MVSFLCRIGLHKWGRREVLGLDENDNNVVYRRCVRCGHLEKIR